MDAVGQEHGCGRAYLETDQPALYRWGSLAAPMLLPYWTDGCIATINQGLEVSETSVYEQLVKVELSKFPFINLHDLPYSNLVIDKGVEHLQAMGVRYYVAVTPEAKAQADANDDLVRRARSGEWNVYEVKNSELVSPLALEPVVIEGKYAKGPLWTHLGVHWFTRDLEERDVLYAAGGPDEWAHLPPKSQRPTTNVFGLTAIGSMVYVDPPKVPVDPVKVSRIETGDDQISFDVDRTGSPVLVKVSYFPNWQASGARGPWRVTPNFMVVIPTSRHVTLRYRATSIEWFAYALSLLGVAGVVALTWHGRRRARREAVAEAAPIQPAARAAPVRRASPPVRKAAAPPRPTKSKRRRRR
jgi:hypothetical protein